MELLGSVGVRRGRGFERPVFRHFRMSEVDFLFRFDSCGRFLRVSSSLDGGSFQIPFFAKGILYDAGFQRLVGGVLMFQKVIGRK